MGEVTGPDFSKSELLPAIAHARELEHRRGDDLRDLRGEETILLVEDEAIEASSPRRRPRPIRLDKATAGLLDERFDLGGDAAGLTLLGERQAVEATRTLLGRPSPCVGRERELNALDGFFQECVSEPMARAVIARPDTIRIPSVAK